MQPDDPTDREGIIERLIDALSHRPGQDATQLARPMGLHKRDVNPILYGSARFRKSADSKPRWYLSGDGQVEMQRAAPATLVEPPTAPVVEIVLDDILTPASPEQLARFTKEPTGDRTPLSLQPNDASQLYEWQTEALQRWHDAGSQGIVDAVTGAGKTRLAIAAIAEHFEEGGKTVVLVPTIVLLHQWVSVLREALGHARIGEVGDGRDDDLRTVDVVVSVVASARNRAFRLDGAQGLLVVDECHRVASEKNQEALDDRFVKRLGLSATHERLDNAHETVLLPFFKRVVFTLNYQRAVSDGVIANVRVAFVGVDFTEEETALYRKMLLDLTNLRRRLIREFGVRPGPFSAFLDDVLRLTGGGLGTRQGGIAANRWLALWRQKRELLAETPAKQQALEGMIGVLRDADRTLLFTQSIASAERISELLGIQGLGCSPHHSEIDSSERALIMHRFGSGELSALASVQTLEEGVDVPDADVAVIVASSKQRRQMVQRMGRVMRRKADGRDARFIIMYVNGTDEDPKYGAHEIFVDELLDVAREADVFALPDDAERMSEFLNPQRN